MESLNNFETLPLLLSLKLAGITTLGLLAIGIPLSYILAFGRTPFKSTIISIITLPIILPPTVIGFYFLVAFSPESFLGNLIYKYFNTHLVFNFSGLVVSSIIYSLPFMVQPIYTAFNTVPKSYLNSLKLLGKSKWNALYHVILPTCKHAILTGCILCFAHTMGEFGIVLMVGGNIPKETRVASSVLYEYVETLNYDKANTYAFILLSISFLLLLLTSKFSQKNIEL